MSKKDEKIIAEAKERFRQCEEAERENRAGFIADLKIAHGDSENGYQWEALERAGLISRSDKRLRLTVNKIQQHNLQIKNDCKNNKPSIKVLPFDDQADPQVAKILNGVIRHIENNSHSETVYDTANDFQIDAGIGYMRVVTEFARDDGDEQEIYIRPVKNPLTIYHDPFFESIDGSDIGYFFDFRDMSKEAAQGSYGEDVKDVQWPDSETGDEWLEKDKIRLAEYWRKIVTKQEMVRGLDGRMVSVEAAGKGLPEDALRRTVKKISWEWYKIAGDKIVERGKWAGRYCPLIRVPGIEVNINGKVHRMGHTRQMRDPQLVYNVMTTSNFEFIGLQTKTPFIGEAAAFAGLEGFWRDANQKNYAYLPYNAEANGRTIARPERAQPPISSQGYQTALQIAREELMMSSGQYQESLGQQSNAQSGVAIQARQRQGDMATGHFGNSQAYAVRYLGRVLIDLIPRIYDTRRVLRIIGQDGSVNNAVIDPDQRFPVADQNGQPVKSDKLTPDQAAQLIYNPGIGRYDVAVEVGKDFKTKNQEFFAAMMDMMGRNPQLMQVAGDLLFKAADFPMADDVAERLRRTLQPALLGEGPTPQEQDMQQKMQHMGEMVQQLKAEAEAAKQQQELDWYRAETERAAKLQQMPPEVAAHIAAQVVMQMQEAGHIHISPPQGVSPPDTPPPDITQDQPQEPPQGGFSLPESLVDHG